MAFESKNMSVISYANGFTLWHYRSERDEMSLICSDNYFANYKTLCHNGDIVMINAKNDTAIKKFVKNEKSIKVQKLN